MTKKLITFLILLLSFICNAQQFYIVGISDGDTVTALDQETKATIKIRLAEIDCPEKKQPFGTKATQFTSKAIFNKVVTIDIIDVDRYGRSIGKIYYDNKYLSAELIKAGLAIVYRKYSKSSELLKLEDVAKKNKTGIWSDPNFIEPSSFRALQKIKK